MRIVAGLALWLLFGAFTFHRTDYEAGGPPGQQLYDVALADLDGVKGLDIVATEYARNSLIVLRNQGGGKFAAPVAWNACGNGNDGPWQIAAGEFSPTTDTKTDIAVACGFVTIVQGNGAGGFNAPQPTSYIARGGLAAGEMNGGGKSELLFGGPAGANVDVLCMMFQPFSSPFVVCGNPTDPQPPLMASVQTGPKAGAPMPVVADEFKPVGEPRHDEVFGLNSTQANAINIYTRSIGDGYQSWNTSSRTVSSGEPYFVDVGDIEGDGDQDVLVGHKGGGAFDLFLWGPSGLATQPKVTNTLTFDNQAGRLADFDRDGKLDAVIAGGLGTIMVHKGNGDGTFGPGQGFGVVGSSSQIALAVGDLNGDARPDIVLVERHPMPATPDKLTALTSIPPAVTPPPPSGPGSPVITGIKAKLLVTTKRVVLGTASNPPTASTVQKLVAHGKVLGRGRTTIAAGQTKRLTITLKRRLKRSLRAKLTITATGPTGLKTTVRKTVRLKRRKR